VVAVFGLAGVEWSEFVLRSLFAASCSLLVFYILPSIKIWYGSAYSRKKRGWGRKADAMSHGVTLKWDCAKETPRGSDEDRHALMSRRFFPFPRPHASAEERARRVFGVGCTFLS
jgi:hypothetical protein